MKKRLIAVLLSCSKMFSTLVATASAYTELSTVKHSAAETHWNIFEEGHEISDGAAINKYVVGTAFWLRACLVSRRASDFTSYLGIFSPMYCKKLPKYDVKFASRMRELRY